VCFAFFCAFDDERKADYLVGSGYVQQHWFFLVGCDQHWGRRKATLKVVEGNLCFCYPGKLICFPEELIEGKGFFA
jgi:hypothetical protein